MQFITHAPDIPDAFLQAHEEGRVVFFCGAGISRSAGLPDFGGLVLSLFQRAGEPSGKAESDLLGQSQFDRAIGHYERRIQEGRTTPVAGYVVHLLHESGLCKQFPADALLLLNAVIADQPWLPRELGQCLGE